MSDGLVKEISLDLCPIDWVALALGVLYNKLTQSLELRSSVVAASGSKQVLVLVETAEVGFVTSVSMKGLYKLLSRKIWSFHCKLLMSQSQLQRFLLFDLVSEMDL